MIFSDCNIPGPNYYIFLKPECVKCQRVENWLKTVQVWPFLVISKDREKVPRKATEQNYNYDYYCCADLKSKCEDERYKCEHEWYKNCVSSFGSSCVVSKCYSVVYLPGVRPQLTLLVFRKVCRLLRKSWNSLRSSRTPRRQCQLTNLAATQVRRIFSSPWQIDFN